MTTTRISPQQMEVGPLPEVEPPPMVAGGMVIRNGVVTGGAVETVPLPRAETISVEQFAAQRRQREEGILDAAARGDPALLYALLKWALRHNDAPSHADLAEWMEEGRQRHQMSGYAVEQLIAATAAAVPTIGRGPMSDEERARRREALARGRATQQAKRAARKADGD